MKIPKPERRRIAREALQYTRGTGPLYGAWEPLAYVIYTAGQIARAERGHWRYRQRCAGQKMPKRSPSLRKYLSTYMEVRRFLYGDDA